jgi:hypothetical protein
MIPDWDQAMDPAWNALPPVAEAAPADASPDGVALGAYPDARAVRDALLALPGHAAPRIDAQRVERLPPAVLQVVLAAARDADAAGSRLTVVNPSFAFSLAFEAYGFGGSNEPFFVEYA